jgi:hypothetical protein
MRETTVAKRTKQEAIKMNQLITENFFLQSATEEQEPWKLPLPVVEC